MANKRVVPGSITEPYKKGKGDFAPNLVGNQITDGSSQFTLGNFSVQTNLEPREPTFFDNGLYSNYKTLDSLNLTDSDSKELVTDNINTTLNSDPTDLTKFAYYGSMVEYFRVSLESIISKWKGSLFITTDEGGFSLQVKNTILSYSYDVESDVSTLRVPTLFINNKFELITNDLGGFILDPNDISNIKLSYDKYELSNQFGNFELLSYIGDSKNNQYLTLTLRGDVFPTLKGKGFGSFNYHIKPKDSVVDRLFFDKLNDFENILLNRLTNPIYSSEFESPSQSGDGSLFMLRKKFTWPVSDGFNIDIDTIEYTQYLKEVMLMCGDYDRFKSNLMTRRFISNSIIEFDTNDGDNTNNGKDRKINKLLNIYGRGFDEVKKYVDSVKYANVVTYDKKNNTPDELIKVMAKTLGFDTIESISDNELIKYIAKSNEIIFEGESRSLSPKEIDTELWRRLVINAWWLFKSKGHRKVVEFFISLFGLNECLVNIDEHVYVAKDKLDRTTVLNSLSEYFSRDLPKGETALIDPNDYPIDEQGFPRVLPNTEDYYFQMKGFWYNNGSQDTFGNNPHYGPYDFGSQYFDKFRCFIDDFEGETNVVRQDFVEEINIFEDYNKGDLEITFEDGKPLEDFGFNYANEMNNDDRVSPDTNLIKAGFSTEISRTGRGSFKLNFSCGDGSCDLECPIFTIDDETGLVNAVFDYEPNSGVLDKTCCELYNFDYANTETPDIYLEGLNPDILEIINNNIKIVEGLYGGDFFDENKQFCQWCRPAYYIEDYDVYIRRVVNESGIDGLILVMLNEGLINYNQIESIRETYSDSLEELISEVIEALEIRYEGYINIVHENSDSITEKCCELRGGVWTDLSRDSSGDFKCVIPKGVEPDDCLCDEVEYCEYGKETEEFTFALDFLNCTDKNQELDIIYGNYEEEGNIDPNDYDEILYGDKRYINYNVTSSCTDIENHYGLRGSQVTTPCNASYCQGKPDGEVIEIYGRGGSDLVTNFVLQENLRSEHVKDLFLKLSKNFFELSETTLKWYLSKCGITDEEGCPCIDCLGEEGCPENPIYVTIPNCESFKSEYGVEFCNSDETSCFNIDTDPRGDRFCGLFINGEVIKKINGDDVSEECCNNFGGTYYKGINGSKSFCQKYTKSLYE